MIVTFSDGEYHAFGCVPSNEKSSIEPASDIVTFSPERMSFWDTMPPAASLTTQFMVTIGFKRVLELSAVMVYSLP